MMNLLKGGKSSKLDSSMASGSFPNVPDPLDFLNEATSARGDDKVDDIEQMDRMIEQISMELQSFGFPECGNLRSTKKKDVKMRIKSF